MRSFYLFLVSLVLSAFFSISTYEINAHNAEPVLVSPHIVISQFQTGGDGPGTFNDEFIELHNIGNVPIDLNGYRLVYRSATGSSDRQFINWASSTVVQPGAYYLIRNTELNLLRVSPQWDTIRSDAHFQNLLRRVGFPD